MLIASRAGSSPELQNMQNVLHMAWSCWESHTFLGLMGGSCYIIDDHIVK